MIRMVNNGPKACPLEGCAAACVELELHSVADPEQVEALLADLADQISFSHFRIENGCRLVVELDTLLPHAIELSRKSEVGIEARPGEVLDTAEENTRTYTFEYAP